MKKDKIIELLKDYENQASVEKFAAYCLKLSIEKDKKTGKLKNGWINNKSEEVLADLFRRVAGEGLVLDGEHVTLQSTGLSYDYIAYKNKMLLSYPESQVDVSLVYEGDEFKFHKEDGKVFYSHAIGNPFNQKDQDIVGAYAVIRNKRGEFLTLLSKEDLLKHRKVAKTDYIWATWFKEMCLKTVIKKACKQHFADIYQEIESQDNDNYELDNPLELDLAYKQDIDAIDDLEALRQYYQKNKGLGKDFDQYVSIRKKQLTE